MATQDAHHLLPPAMPQLQQALDAQAARQDAAAADAPDGKRKPSAGEVAFDRVVYTGIGFGVNEASSLWITDQFMYGEPKFGKWFSKQGFDALSEKIVKSFKITDGVDALGKVIPAKAKAGNSLLMVTLLSGGTLLILPMKWLEDHKIQGVKWANHVIDRFRGDKLSAEETATRDGEVEQAIACAKRQSWPSMMLGRVIACASSVSTGTFLVGPKNNERLMNWSEKMLTGKLQPEGRRGMANRYARLLSVETYSCAISSIVLEIASKLFAKRGKQVHDPELCQAKDEPPAVVADTGGDACGCRAARILRADRRHTAPPTPYGEKIHAEKEMAAGQSPVLG